MKREIIELDEHGILHMPEVSGDSIWMSEPELMGLFGITASTFRSAVKSVYKKGIVPSHEAERHIRLPNGNGLDIYGIGLIAALAFHLDSYGAKQLREYLIGRMGNLDKRKGAYLLVCPLRVKEFPPGLQN